jgi:hypothetical protein
MLKLKDLQEKFISRLSINYIKFVYKTSKVEMVGNIDRLLSKNDEKFIVVFWHGDSYCLLPMLRGQKLNVILTKDRRGDYIALMNQYYGYESLRVPDISENGQHFLKIVRLLKTEPTNLALALDGPLGPYHIPKDFAFVTALLTGRRILPTSIKVKNKIELFLRWDKYKIPLPFNKITFEVMDPVEVLRNDKGENFSAVKKKIVSIME